MNAPVLLNLNPQQFQRLLDQAKQQGWQVRQLARQHWQHATDVYQAFTEALELPDYVGANLDGLAEALIDLADEYADVSGLVIAMQGYAMSELAESAWHDDFMLVLSDVIAAWQEENKHLMLVSYHQD